MNNKLLLFLGSILILVGFFKPNINNIITVKPSNDLCVVESYVIDPPSDKNLLDNSQNIIDILRQSDDSTKNKDCLKLSSLYSDIAQLIELDNEDKVINDTASIRFANSLSGKMLRLNIKDKYPGLADASKALLVSEIGDNDIVLDDEVREKAVSAFRALSWAFYEGSK